MVENHCRFRPVSNTLMPIAKHLWVRFECRCRAHIQKNKLALEVLRLRLNPAHDYAARPGKSPHMRTKLWSESSCDTEVFTFISRAMTLTPPAAPVGLIDRIVSVPLTWR